MKTAVNRLHYSPSNANFLPKNPLNATTLILTALLARATAVLLTLGLFTIGSLPTAGHAFPGAMHWAAHLAAITRSHVFETEDAIFPPKQASPAS